MRYITLTLLLVSLLSVPKQADAFAYIFAGANSGGSQLSVDIVTHPSGYTGVGGDLIVTIGIDPSNVGAADMIVSTQNVVNTFNGKAATTGNISFGQIAPNQIDFESVLLHEVGHSLGLAHVNAASESGLPNSQQNFTKALFGGNGSFDLDAGADGVIGSADDVRGDDVNLNYFKMADNNPFTIADVVDSTTYSRDLADLPTGDLFSANGDRDVADLLSFSGTEAVMQQGSFFGEIQRTLSADDVAGIKFAEAGLDRLAGTIDDYNLILQFEGLTTSADIVISDNTTSFAFSRNSGSLLNANHIRVINQGIFMNTDPNTATVTWFFNQQSNAIPEPTSGCLVLLGSSLLLWRRRRV